MAALMMGRLSPKNHYLTMTALTMGRLGPPKKPLPYNYCFEMDRLGQKKKKKAMMMGRPEPKNYYHTITALTMGRLEILRTRDNLTKREKTIKETH